MDEVANGSNAAKCLNCGTALQGDFCYQCGQAAKDTRRLFIGLVQDVFVETLAIDGKLVRSILQLLWHPGRVARRFLDGQRVRHSPPFRLYLFTSVFFFIALFAVISLPDGPPERGLPESGVISTDTSQSKTEWSEINYNGPDWVEPHVQRLYEAGQRVGDDPRLFIAEARANLPRFLLIAPVIYALTLMLLYVYRRKYLVYDHFIVSLYMHAALYAYLLLALLLSQIPVIGPWLIIPPLLWAALQPFAVFRQAYASNWFSVVIKGSVSLMIYLMMFSLIITLGLSFALYQS